ncbi:copper amine oxidase [Paenibacillus sp. F6_3S_P_1C]|uniref:Copper amine oxidase n=1 Tax=Paenibacillus vandeheii TaxID=3035917 RepID=A0ABT8J4Q2_9BACL|nr:stalk domain-containing protein [Paenibacillus vandeheii]MDN4600048.1 copper amine oxidase [Paenibacillus vandeheii]
MKKFAHKVAYIAGGIIIGVVFSTSAGAFADTIKSMVGKKVTGEYSIVVNGQSLVEKGAVIDSRANVPARALSEALGADVKVEGRTISITSDEVLTDTGNTETSTTNKYDGLSKTSIEESIKTLKENIIPFNERMRASVLAEIEQAKTAGADELVKTKQNQLKEVESQLSQAKQDLSNAESALSTAK